MDRDGGVSESSLRDNRDVSGSIRPQTDGGARD